MQKQGQGKMEVSKKVSARRLSCHSSEKYKVPILVNCEGGKNTKKLRKCWKGHYSLVL